MFKKRQRSNEPASERIIIEDLSKQLIPITGTKPFAISIHNLLTPNECTDLIQRAEDLGFDDALIQGPDGKQILCQNIRRCGRCIIDDVALADAIYIRILNALRGTEFEKKIMHAPWVTNSSRSTSLISSSSSSSSLENNNNAEAITAVGLNERIRFLKYEPGHFFAPHQDIRFVRGLDSGDKAGEMSHITVQLYLNEKFKGGSTRFLCGKRHYDVIPKVGSALIFDHDLLHEGVKVKGGIKYSVRTDIMFTPPKSASSTATSSRRDRDPLGIFGSAPQA
mmetsp:Transcript_24263/g.52334  ORF Transcript_24263/g.52334 Transcript_24263/m.52334 type:complete len:280 (+) Transcript_24263:305-1144(+)